MQAVMTPERFLDIAQKGLVIRGREYTGKVQGKGRSRRITTIRLYAAVPQPREALAIGDLLYSFPPAQNGTIKAIEGVSYCPLQWRDPFSSLTERIGNEISNWKGQEPQWLKASPTVLLWYLGDSLRHPFEVAGRHAEFLAHFARLEMWLRMVTTTPSLICPTKYWQDKAHKDPGAVQLLGDVLDLMRDRLGSFLAAQIKTHASSDFLNMGRQ